VIVLLSGGRYSDNHLPSWVIKVGLLGFAMIALALSDEIAADFRSIFGRFKSRRH
jgi:hypothetical protein